MKKTLKLIFSILLSSSFLLGCNANKTSKNKEVEIIIDNNEKTTFELNVTSLELLVGETFTLTPKSYVSSEGLTWYSSAKNIVSVDKNGQLEALEQGSAVISAYDSISVSSVTVIVSAPNNKLSISLSTNQLALGIGENYACRVLVTIKKDGIVDENIVPNILIKETSSDNIATFSKVANYYRFVGLNVGTITYSFTASLDDTIIGTNLYITVKDVK